MNKRLAEERQRLRLSQKEVSSFGGITERTYCAYEVGDSEPKISFILKLENLGFDSHYIIYGERKKITEIAEPAANYAVLNKKKLDKVFDDLTPEQQADVVKIAEEKRRLNRCLIENEELRKKVG